MPNQDSRTPAGWPSVQFALVDLQVLGTWEWDGATDRARTDAFVAHLFNVDPQDADASLPVASFMKAIHPDDQQRVIEQIRTGVLSGGSYKAEYRVCSADRVVRWVVDLGRFYTDPLGLPQYGRGIVIDLTSALARSPEGGSWTGEPLEPPLARAAAQAIAAHRAIAGLGDPRLASLADALLMGIGHKLARPFG